MGSASPFVSLISIEAGAKERIPPWRNGLVLPPGYDYSLTWSIDEGIRNLRERERREGGVAILVAKLGEKRMGSLISRARAALWIFYPFLAEKMKSFLVRELLSRWSVTQFEIQCGYRIMALRSVFSRRIVLLMFRWLNCNISFIFRNMIKNSFHNSFTFLHLCNITFDNVWCDIWLRLVRSYWVSCIVSLSFLR